MHISYRITLIKERFITENNGRV